MGMLAAAMISLAAQHRPSCRRQPEPRLCRRKSREVLRPGTRSPGRFAASIEPLADFRGGLAAFSTILPHPVHSGGPARFAGDAGRSGPRSRTTAGRRRSTSAGHLSVHLRPRPLPRFAPRRKRHGLLLRRRSKPASPAQLLGNILRDGPAVGVYTLAWCDSLTAVQRSFDRQSLREFALRVLLQMSANDSSHLIDSPTGQQAWVRTWRFSTTKKKAAWKNSGPMPGRRSNGSLPCRNDSICAFRRKTCRCVDSELLSLRQLDRIQSATACGRSTTVHGSVILSRLAIQLHRHFGSHRAAAIINRNSFFVDRLSIPFHDHIARLNPGLFRGRPARHRRDNSPAMDRPAIAIAVMPGVTVPG